MFLTPSELETLTGYAQNGRQRRWLESHQWIYETRRDGRVVVSKAYVESRLSGIPQKKEWAPNFDAFKKVA